MCNTAYNLRALWLFYNDTFAVTAYTHNNLSLKSGEASALLSLHIPLPFTLPPLCFIKGFTSLHRILPSYAGTDEQMSSMRYHVTTSCDHSVIALGCDYCSWEMNSLLRWTISLTCWKLGAIHHWSEVYLHLSLPLIGHQDLPIHEWARTDPHPSPMHGSSSPHCWGTKGQDCIQSKEGILNKPCSPLLLYPQYPLQPSSTDCISQAFASSNLMASSAQPFHTGSDQVIGVVKAARECVIL